jgi:LysM repeat protein
VGNNSYVVVAGDNLSRVAAAHGVSVRQLVLANSILDPDRIAVGQLLFIP